MTVGDAAKAQGWPLVQATDDRRRGWEEINRSRDLAAGVKQTADTAKKAAEAANAAGEAAAKTADEAKRLAGTAQATAADAKTAADTAAAKDYVDQQVTEQTTKARTDAVAEAKKYTDEKVAEHPATAGLTPQQVDKKIADAVAKVKKDLEAEITQRVAAAVKNIPHAAQGVLPIEKGGTGATTWQQARENLGITVSTQQPAYQEGRVWIPVPTVDTTMMAVEVDQSEIPEADIT